MKPGRESQTAVMVCAWRALAEGATAEPKYSDPTAFALLPDEVKRRVERLRAKDRPRGLRERFERALNANHARVMVARTVAIDEAIRQSRSPQLVILGAGLDGRAWRMSELRDVTVFEVDHPDSQQQKKERVAALTQAARAVRFVPVDFTRDRLDEALTAAGHDATQPTTWVWEGVVMYLTPDEIAAALAVLERRSAVGSRLIIVYHSPALILRLIGLGLGRLGEPLRSEFRQEAMRALLARYRFAVLRDEDSASIGRALSADVARATRHAGHLRIATAERQP